MISPKTPTQILIACDRGDEGALDELLPLVYRELRAVAENQLRGERSDHTLQPTALVHEAYLRLIDQREVDWQNRTHFFSVAAEMMRRILVNYARDRNTQKRGGTQHKVALDEAISSTLERDIEVVSLDDALTDLAELDPRQARIVELRFFAGLTVEEVAEVLDVSPATIKREWRTAKLWLKREMTEDGDE